MPGLDDVLAALHSDSQTSDEAVEEETDPQDAPTVFELAPAVRRPIPTPDIPTDEPDTDAEGGRRTLSVHRTLRSGSIVRYDGDVNIFGDVNAGSQVRAGGNVVVMGRLRGVVHAGCHGDESAFILAFELSATQLRIGKQIAIAPPVRKSPNFSPEIALVSDGTITIEPYRGRLRR
jgi:septum site-determining protein MinC